jgi:hypothetical protein
MNLFNPSRDQVRRFFIDAWQKHREAGVLTPLETMAVDIVAAHPEYHALLAKEDTLTREWTPADGELNPFLHLSLHLAVAEQLQIDQPPGLRAAFAHLCERLGERHDALHAVLECLGETLFAAQRSGTAPDGEAYLECVRRRL